MRFLIQTCIILLFSIYESLATNVILVMADDQGWGQTGYYNHPILKTPHLDRMAKNGLRFDRFYAGGPVCSPTRATVLTGRTHDRTGVLDHGYPLRKQEKTLSEAMRKKGYATAHFGKWHLNGLRGPGVPIIKNDTHGPGGFGFDYWLSVTNFFDLNPVMSRNGSFENFSGDSSEIIVNEALEFITQKSRSNIPFFVVIWYGTPHSPWMTLDKDKVPFENLNEQSMNHYGELVAMDRSIGTLRAGLKKLNINQETLVWFTSDNGGLPRINPSTTGGLRDFKGSLYEGGIRVPAIIEFPKMIKPRVTNYTASAADIFPTIADVCDLPDNSMLTPQDGISLTPLFKKELINRKRPIVFHSRGRSALISNNHKILSFPKKGKKDSNTYELYDLNKDPSESTNLLKDNHSKNSGSKTSEALAEKMISLLKASNESIEKSMNGEDYPEKSVNEGQPKRQFWTEVDHYKKYFSQWKNRPEYKSRLRNIK